MTEEIQKLLNASSKLQSDGEDIVDALLQEIQSAENSLENSDFMGTSDTGEHQRRFARQTFSKQELNANGITITFGFTFDGVQEYKDLTKHPRLSHVANLEIDRDPQVKSFEEQGLNKMLHFNPAKDRILHITGDHLDVNGAISDEYYIEIGEGGICHIKSLDRKLITCSPPTESPEAAEKNYVIYKRKKTPHVQVNIGNIHSSVGYIYYETNFWVDKEWIRITTFTMSAVLFLIILAVIVFKVWQRNKSPSDDKAMSEMRVVTNHEGTNVKDKVDVGPFLGRKLNPEIRSKVDDCRIDMKRLHLGDRAGKGNFGEVYKGQLTSLLGNRQAVVVKTLKDDKEVNFHDFEDFLKEATILLDFKHSNVLSLIGVVCEEGNRPLIVLPYMEHGDLHRLISDDSFDMGLVDMVQFAYQIANGMFYLSKQRFVHRDLAARNCLVDSNYVVKISDFGMSRDVYDRDYYVMENRQKPLPMRWMAIESLREGRYTTKSDVWSFGVTMWELLTRGSTPYPGIPNSDIKKHICAGQKLEQPEACPSTIYEVMLNCWEYKPDSRTNFSEISQFLDLLLRSNKQEPSKGIHLCEKSYRSATR